MIRCPAALVLAATFAGSLGAGGPIHCGVEMRHVALHVADGVVLQIDSLDGEFISRSAHEPPIFDDPTSYTLDVRRAEMSIDATSLTTLLNRRAFAGPHAPLSDVRVTIEHGALRAHGKLHKGVSVPFEMTAAVSATPDGRLRLHATKLKAVGIPVKGLLDLLGLQVDRLMKMPPGAGIRADGDDLLIDTAAILPPPRTEGRLADVRVSGHALRLRMIGSADPPARPASRPDPAARNYLYFYGGSIRFGRLTMANTDLQLIDANPRDPFDFFPADYNAQLVAGYSRNTRRGGLRVYMPDYARVRANGGMLKAPRVR
ncbi:MAG TPA: hypothetical protein VFX12_10895 [Vicinamibacterales bacterium]|nr:hypothetical protein [Vicinamibacterales bacterium]